MANAIFAILKKVGGGEIEIAQTMKGDFLSVDPEAFREVMAKKIQHTLVTRAVKRLRIFKPRKYSPEEIDAAFKIALTDWVNEFKRQTIYMK